MVEIVSYADWHFAGVEALWEAVFQHDPPWNRAAVAIPAKLLVQPELFIVAETSGHVVGTIMAGYDGHRGWLYSVAVRPDHQRQGAGSRMLAEAERRLARAGCTKINLQVRTTNDGAAAFYRRHGYLEEQRVSMGKRLAGACPTQV
ncbi:GNAT family acetyltransferase [Sphingomonas baiyangensis]